MGRGSRTALLQVLPSCFVAAASERALRHGLLCGSDKRKGFKVTRSYLREVASLS